MTAEADASAGDQFATALAFANGGYQQVVGSNATASVVNNGIINVIADAHAVNTLTGTTAGAFASANATGIGQRVTATGTTGARSLPEQQHHECRRGRSCDRRGRG